MRSDSPRWHPILETVEQPVGTWTVSFRTGQQREQYLRIRLVRRGPEVGYRVDALPTGQLVGYYRTLLAAAQHGHQAWVSTRSYGTGPNVPSGRPNPWTAA